MVVIVKHSQTRWLSETPFKSNFGALTMENTNSANDLLSQNLEGWEWKSRRKDLGGNQVVNKSMGWNSIPWKLYVKLYLFNENDTRKMYRTCQTPSTNAFWEKDNIRKIWPFTLSCSQTLLSTSSSGDYKWEGRRNKEENNETHTHTQRKIITWQTQVKPDLLTSQLHNQAKVITVGNF